MLICFCYEKIPPELTLFELMSSEDIHPAALFESESSLYLIFFRLS